MVRYQTSTWQGKSRAVPMSDLISWNVRPIESYPTPVQSFTVTRVVLLDNQGFSRLSCNSVLYFVYYRNTKPSFLLFSIWHSLF